MELSEATSSEINELFSLARIGKIAQLSKKELERYAVVLIGPESKSMFRSDEFQQNC